MEQEEALQFHPQWLQPVLRSNQRSQGRGNSSRGSPGKAWRWNSLLWIPKEWDNPNCPELSPAMPQPMDLVLIPLTPGSYSNSKPTAKRNSPAANGARAPSQQLPLPGVKARLLQHNGELLIITDTSSPAEPPSCCQETREKEKTFGNSTILFSHLL